MYGIVAHFDKETEQYIKKIWSELSERSISKYAEEVKGRRPHLTLASYHNLKIEEYVPAFNQFYKSKSSFTMTMSVLGTFMKSGLLFLAPTPSSKLLNFHTAHHEHFAKYYDHPDSLYLPSKWVPHCTIANRISPDKLKEALEYCTDRMDTFETEIKEISMLKLVDKNNVPTIHTCFLK